VVDQKYKTLKGVYIMKNIQNLLLLSLSISTLLGCVGHEKITSFNSTTVQPEEAPVILTNNNIVPNSNNSSQEEATTETDYGAHTNEIQEFLATTPMGSEIYVEEKENGEWYLKVEKTFTVEKSQEKTENIEPIYGESILI